MRKEGVPIRRFLRAVEMAKARAKARIAAHMARDIEPPTASHSGQGAESPIPIPIIASGRPTMTRLSTRRTMRKVRTMTALYPRWYLGYPTPGGVP